jgi:hypothetical protein
VAGPGTFVLHDVVVLQTYAIPGVLRTEVAGFEVWLAPDLQTDRQQATVLRTPDADLYRRALEAEGEEIRFDARWHWGRRPSGKRCQVLDSLEECA